MNNIGFHLSTISLPKLFKFVNEHETNTIQLFLSNPRSGRMSNFKCDDLMKYKDKFDELNVFIHSPYIYNLAKNIKVKTLFKELDCMNIMNFKYYILHVGKDIDITHGNENMTKNINLIINYIKHNNYHIKILLETPSGQGNELLSTSCLDYLKEYFNYAKNFDIHYFGLCIDTCHIFVNGFDLNDSFYLKKFFKLAKHKLVHLIHLNNSKNEVCSKVDRHESLHKGKIKTMDKIIKFLHHKKINCVLETHSFNYHKDYKYIMSLL